eukprot:UN01639
MYSRMRNRTSLVQWVTLKDNISMVIFFHIYQYFARVMIATNFI